MRALAWLGRQGTRAIAVLAAIGIATPPLGELFQPLFTPSVVVLLTISFLRLDMASLRRYLRRPALVIAATLWTTVAIPLLFGAVCLALGLERTAPELFFGITLYAVASPMVAAPAFAALMGLDATLVLFTLVASTVVIPITGPLIAGLFVGSAIAFSPLSLSLTLFAILGGSAIGAAILRRFISPDTVRHFRSEIDGVNIVVLFVFVSVATRGVAASFSADPLFVIALIALAFALFLALLGATALVFRRAGRDQAFALGFMTAQRNMGLMIAATTGVLPDTAWLFFALAQIPLYLAPALLQPIAKRLTGS